MKEKYYLNSDLYIESKNDELQIGLKFRRYKYQNKNLIKNNNDEVYFMKIIFNKKKN